MRKSLLYETIIKELKRINKLSSFFDRNDFQRLSNKHQKYMVFVYKHSDINNKGKMTIYFKRKAKSSPLEFKVDIAIHNQYLKQHKVK